MDIIWWKTVSVWSATGFSTIWRESARRTYLLLCDALIQKSEWKTKRIHVNKKQGESNEFLFTIYTRLIRQKSYWSNTWQTTCHWARLPQDTNRGQKLKSSGFAIGISKTQHLRASSLATAAIRGLEMKSCWIENEEKTQRMKLKQSVSSENVE
jgi:hypothetical protein